MKKLTPQVERLISFFDFESIEKFKEKILKKKSLTGKKIGFSLDIYGRRTGRRIDIVGYTIFAMIHKGMTAESADSINKGKTYWDFDKEKKDSGYDTTIALMDFTSKKFTKDNIISFLKELN